MNFPLYRPSPLTIPRRGPLPVGTVLLALALLFAEVWGAPRTLSDGLMALTGLPVAGVAVLAVVALALIGAAERAGLKGLRATRAAHAHRRATDEFEADVEAALETERRELVRQAGRRPGIILGLGTVDSAVRIASESTRLVQSDLPLVLRPPGELRVLGPPDLADVALDAFVAQVLSRSGAVSLGVDDRRIAGGRRITIGGAPGDGAAGSWVLTSGVVWARPPGRLTELWLGPDGSACVRSDGQAEGRWVRVEPRFE